VVKIAPKDISFHSRHILRLGGFEICPILFFGTVSVFPSHLVLIHLVLLLFEKVMMYQYDFTISVGCWNYSRLIVYIIIIIRPSARCASTANVVCKDVDVFGAGNVPINHLL
jgi:hypothetical protein